MANDHDHGHDHGPKDAGTEAWHRMLHHTGHDELSEDTAQTPGMRRYEAISGKRNGSRKIWMGKNHVGPGMVSADHHHGEAETGIYVVSGHPVFVFLEDGEERRVETGPGDYIYVPPYVPHREENPSPDEEAVVVLARSTQEGIVVNLPSLRAEVPELDELIAQLAAEDEPPRPQAQRPCDPRIVAVCIEPQPDSFRNIALAVAFHVFVGGLAIWSILLVVLVAILGGRASTRRRSSSAPSRSGSRRRSR